MMASDTTSPIVSNHFDLSSSDITLQSSDRVLFKVHRVNLEMHSRVFADAGSSTGGTTQDEIVVLSESAAVLELMLQYLYLQPQPDLRPVEFEVMKDLAEAVEKYEIYCAMGVCSIRMREWIHDHPVDVMLYAIRHKYSEIANESAVATLNIAPYSMLSGVPPNVFEAWIGYLQSYQAIVTKEFSRFGPTRLHRGVTTPCEVWHEHYSLIAAELGQSFGPTKMHLRDSNLWATARGMNTSPFPARPESGNIPVLVRLPMLLDRRQALTGERCGDCKRDLGYWIHQTERDWRELGRFTEFL